MPQISAEGSYIDEFLCEHGLQEKLSATIALIYNAPVPNWLQLVNALDLTDIQRGELMAALANEWAASGNV